MIKWFFRGPFDKINYKIFVKEAKGLGNISKEGGFIVAANHSSHMDIIGLSAVFLLEKNINIRYLAKKELFTNWLFKQLKIIYGGISIDRDLKGKKALKEAINALKQRDVIGIFPEGTRSLTGKIQRGKTGVARLALWAKAPVVPVGIKGTFEILPKGKKLPKLKKNIVINIGKPMYFDKHYKKKLTEKLLRSITDQVMKEISILSGKKYQK